MATIEEVKARAKEKDEGVIGLVMCFLDSFDRLDISTDQWMQFFDATPSGEQLWRAFTARRDAEEYTFLDYVQEVLDSTGARREQVGNSDTEKRKVTEREIVEKLSSVPNGTKVRITFVDDDEESCRAVAFLVMMQNKIITMDFVNFIILHTVRDSGRWEELSRTCEVTLAFRQEGDLQDLFAPRLGYRIVELEIV